MNFSTSGMGVRGAANAASGTTYGVYGVNLSSSGIGVYGEAAAASGTTYGVYGNALSPAGYALYANGKLGVIAPSQTVASAAGAEYTTGTFTAPTITLTGSTGVTMQMDSFLFSPPTITDASAVTVTDAATLTIAGAPVKAGSVTLIDTYGLMINGGAVSTATNSYGLYVNAQTGATNNVAAAFMGGRVGVGTALPGNSLNVHSGIIQVTSASSGTGSTAGLQLSMTNDTAYIGNRQNDHIVFHTNGGVEKMRLTNVGNLGIGDSTPDHKLDVAGNIGLDASAYINFGDTDGTTGYGIRDNAGTIECKNSGGSWAACAGGGGGTPGGANTQIQFNNSGAFGGSANFVWDNTNSRVGIGTSAPTTTLHARKDVDGSASILRLSNLTGGAASTNETIEAIFGLGDGTTDFGGPAIVAGKESDYTSAANRDSFLAFHTMLNDTRSEKMRITSAGNVGIGVTNPAWQLHTGADGVGRSGVTVEATTENAYLNLFRTGDSVTIVNKNDGTFRLNHSGSSSDSHLVISTTGNVGIATAGPGERLHVVGSIMAEGTGGGGRVIMKGTSAAPAGHQYEWYPDSPTGGDLSLYDRTAGATRLEISAAGKLTVNSGIIQVESDMGRFKGWSAAGATGLGAEIGISSGEGYLLAYNRTTSAYSNINLQAGLAQLKAVAADGTFDVTGNMKLGTTGTTANTRSFTVKDQTQSQVTFGSYPGAWTSAVQIQNNNNTRFLWMSPLDAASGDEARFVTAGTGLDFYVNGTGASSGTLAMTLASSGAVSIPGALTVGSCSGCASAAGANTQVQYNNSGALGAAAEFTYNGTTLSVSESVSGSTPLISAVNTYTSNAAVNAIYGQIDGYSSSDNAAAIRGVSTQAGAGYIAPGVRGDAASPNGVAVYGIATGSNSSGIRGSSSGGSSSKGVYGSVSDTTNTNYGVYGYSPSTSGTGVYGNAGAGTGGTYGVYGTSASTTGYGVYGRATAAGTNFTYGVYGHSDSDWGAGVYGYVPNGAGIAIRGQSGTSATSGMGVRGDALASSGATYGVYGQAASTSGWGIYCNAQNNANGCGGNRAWNNTSDVRLKDQIIDLSEERGLDAIMKLRPVTYHWKGKEEISKKQRLGLIAQDVLDIYPELVGTNGPDQNIDYGDGKKETVKNVMSLSYAEFVVPLIKAVQEQQAQIEDLKAANDNLARERDAATRERAEFRSELDELRRTVVALQKSGNGGAMKHDTAARGRDCAGGDGARLIRISTQDDGGEACCAALAYYQQSLDPRLRAAEAYNDALRTELDELKDRTAYPDTWYERLNPIRALCASH
ncbi:MAG: tail fiber domain-containing protein [Betaproteobacteria bacterium]